jgi:phosphoribosyl 1,2-cyclic phosphodiesterase
LALQEIGESASCLDGILVTHEHTDHSRSVGSLIRRYQLPLYANQRTIEAMRPTLGKIRDELVRPFISNQPFAIGDLAVAGFRTAHDAAESVAYRIDTRLGAVSVCTDLGWPDPVLLNQLAGSRLVLVEANYDPVMLAAGPYPRLTKQRIASDWGHLSNLDSARAILSLIEQGTEHFVLAHISQENNYPQLALQTVQDQLQNHKALAGRDWTLGVARRYAVSPPVEWT